MVAVYGAPRVRRVLVFSTGLSTHAQLPPSRLTAEGGGPYRENTNAENGSRSTPHHVSRRHPNDRRKLRPLRPSRRPTDRSAPAALPGHGAEHGVNART